ncbi:aminoglycoside phosphotransferase family protein [Streptomyces albidoflavus]
MESLTARLVGRFGPRTAQWCAAVPELLARLASRWGLVLGGPLPDGASSVTLRCRWPDGTPAVLKIGPERELLAEQAVMLGWFAPSGRVPAVLGGVRKVLCGVRGVRCVLSARRAEALVLDVLGLSPGGARVRAGRRGRRAGLCGHPLALDAAAGAMVLEEVVPGTPVAELPAPGPGPWAELMAALHGAAPAATTPRLLRGRMEEAFARVGRRLAEPAVGARLDAAAWDRALGRCERLLDTETTTVLLHGDLHPGNVLDGGAGRGLVAIDPKACAGDPCFDAVDFVVAGAGREGVEARCAGVAAAYGLDPDRLHAWSRVDAAFAAVARLGAGDEGPAVEELLALTR